MLSSSTPPSVLGEDLIWLAFGCVFSFAVIAMPLALWLLPGCVVTRRIASARGVRGITSAVVIGGLAAAVGFGTIYFFPSLFEWPLTRELLLRKLPTALMGATFVFTWFLAFQLLSPRAESVGAADTVTVADTSVLGRAFRTTAETLSIVAVVTYTATIGGIAAGFIDYFGGDDTYTIKAESSSPNGVAKAYSVLDITPGGALGNMYEEVYVLPASETWTATHRGLLLWHARHVDIQGLHWASDSELRVRISSSDYRNYADHIIVYRHDSYAARTDPIPE